MKEKINIDTFNIYFRKYYSYMSHSLANDEIEVFLNSHSNITDLPKMADLFADYLLANGICEVQE